MIKVVIYDVGGVLHELDMTMGDVLQTEFGITDEQELAISNDQIHRFGIGQLDESGFWRELTKKYGIRPVKPSEKLLSRIFGSQLKRNEVVLETARQISRAGLKVAVLSNTNVVHAELVEKAGIYDQFTDRFLSHEVGLRKPDPRIYQNALQALKVKPEEVIFIDDKEANVTAAKALGINGIVFKNTEQFIQELSALLPGIKLESR